LNPPASLIAFKNAAFMRFMTSACSRVDPFASFSGSNATMLLLHASLAPICAHTRANLRSSSAVLAPEVQSSHSQLSWCTLTSACRPRAVIWSSTVDTRSSHAAWTV
jgi:hypothetical protein